MPKRTFAELISLERLRRWATADVERDGRVWLARSVLDALDQGGMGAAEVAFFTPLRDYFYNLAATEKRRHADSIALSFCETDQAADEMFELMKEKGVMGRSRSAKI